MQKTTIKKWLPVIIFCSVFIIYIAVMIIYTSTVVVGNNGPDSPPWTLQYRLSLGGMSAVNAIVEIPYTFLMLPYTAVRPLLLIDMFANWMPALAETVNNVLLFFFVFFFSPLVWTFVILGIRVGVKKIRSRNT